MQTRFSASGHSPRAFTPVSPSPPKYTRSYVTRHQTCVIDLSEADDTPSTEDYLLSEHHTQPNRENDDCGTLGLGAAKRQQRCKGLQSMNVEETGNSQLRQGKRKYKIKRKEIIIQENDPAVVDIQPSLVKEISKSSCGTNKPNNKAISILFNGLTTMSSIQQTEHTQDNIFASSQKLFPNIFFEKHSHSAQNDLKSIKDAPSFKKQQSLNSSINLQGKQPRRRTRNRPRIEGQFYEQPAQIDFYDDQVKTRIKVAKYRYLMEQCSKEIDWLNDRVSARIHNCQKIAHVSSEPQVGLGSYKHRIFLQCLKMQFKKRKFVYLE